MLKEEVDTVVITQKKFESSQREEHPTGTWKVMGSTPVGRTQIFSELSRLCQLLLLTL